MVFDEKTKQHLQKLFGHFLSRDQLINYEFQLYDHLPETMDGTSKELPKVRTHPLDSKYRFLTQTHLQVISLTHDKKNIMLSKMHPSPARKISGKSDSKKFLASKHGSRSIVTFPSFDI